MTWCARGRRPSRINCGLAIGWGSIFCATGSVPRSRCALGRENYLEWIKAEGDLRSALPTGDIGGLPERGGPCGGAIARLEKAIDEAIEQAPADDARVIEALQACAAWRRSTAVTIVAEVGSCRASSTAPAHGIQRGGIQ